MGREMHTNLVVLLIMDTQSASVNLSYLRTPEAFQEQWGEGGWKLIDMLMQLRTHHIPNRETKDTKFAPIIASVVPGFQWNDAWIDHTAKSIHELMESVEKPFGLRAYLPNYGGYTLFTLTVNHAEYSYAWYYSYLDHGFSVGRAEDVLELLASFVTGYEIAAVIVLLSLLASAGSRGQSDRAWIVFRNLVEHYFPEDRHNDTSNLRNMPMDRMKLVQHSRNFIYNSPKCSEEEDAEGDLVARNVGYTSRRGGTPSEVFMGLWMARHLRLDTDLMQDSYRIYGYLAMLTHIPEIHEMSFEHIQRMGEISPEYDPEMYIKMHPNVRLAFSQQVQDLADGKVFICCEKFRSILSESQII